MPPKATKVTPVESGECVVCGIVTENRCKDCLQHGADFLWFCSIEHKKLVFSLHRKVCGNRSHPFRFPGFSTAEVRDIASMAFYQNSPEITAKAREICKAEEGIYRDKDVLGHALFDLWEGPKGRLQSESVSQSVISFRHELFKQFANSCLSEGSHSERLFTPSVRQPFGYLIDWTEKVIPGLASNYGQYGEWRSRFYHQFLIYLSIFHQTSDTDNREFTMYQKRSLVHLMNICTETIYKTPPKEAKALSAALCTLRTGYVSGVSWAYRSDRTYRSI